MTGRKSPRAMPKPCWFPLPPTAMFCYSSCRAAVVVEARPSELFFRRHHHDLPRHSSIHRGHPDSSAGCSSRSPYSRCPSSRASALRPWAYHTGAGWLGPSSSVSSACCAHARHRSIPAAIVPRSGPKLTIAPRSSSRRLFAGYHAVHGIVKHTMPSEIWQTVFSVIGADRGRASRHSSALQEWRAPSSEPGAGAG